VDELRAQIARVAAALEVSEAAAREKDVQIANLGSRLNAALAARVEELQRYRSDFFGRLRDLLGERPEVRVVGDRFVFQSEVLFPAGQRRAFGPRRSSRSAPPPALPGPRGAHPADVNWILRVDGHADRNPIRSGRFASNWELRRRGPSRWRSSSSRRAAVQPRRGDRLRRQPAARHGGHAGGLRAQPSDRAAPHPEPLTTRRDGRALV
jgi:flagellar motor protein MotB